MHNHPTVVHQLRSGTKPEEGKRKSKHADTRELPADIIEEILACLPAMSLRRFYCVSRSWAVMLVSDAFVELHFHRANHRSHPKLFLPPLTWRDCKIQIYSLEPIGPVKRLLRIGKVTDGMLQSMTTSCRGLVLVRGWDRDRGRNIIYPYYVLNPSTGDLLALPDGSRPALSEHYYLGWFDILFGLGYDQLAKVYKVARFYSHQSYIAGSLTVCCEIFTLGTSVHWRPAAGHLPLELVFKEMEGVFLNGCLHWLVGTSSGTDYILSFNVSDETFGAIQLPSGVQCFCYGALSKLDECLCIRCHPFRREEMHEYEVFWKEETIWMLQDYEAGRWEKCCTFDRSAWPKAECDLLQGSIIPLAMYYGSGRKGKIMFVSSEGIVFAVNSDGSALEILLWPTQENLEEGLRNRNSLALQFQLFEESLVALAHLGT